MQREADRRLEPVHVYLRDDKIHEAREEALSYAFYADDNKILQAHAWYMVALREFYYPSSGEALRRNERLRGLSGQKKIWQDISKMRIAHEEMENILVRKRMADGERSRRVWSTTSFDQQTVLEHCQEVIEALNATPRWYDESKTQLRARVDNLIAKANSNPGASDTPMTSEEGLDELSSLLISLASIEVGGDWDATMTGEATRDG